ncbi:hypothetical protein DFH08DRAFT_827926 [Mycena albidolilacea]|uniref:Carboxylesterase type B domain-containing protein n=1 Tax=Mycena albidolilacea TaxID=1033008 RepID=A0AAD6YY21_9AGAR|nr:hypothetical protein DFH08DRAFT_827926 [Mycena albidolilacea]
MFPPALKMDGSDNREHQSHVSITSTPLDCLGWPGDAAEISRFSFSFLTTGGSADFRYNGSWIVQASIANGKPLVFVSINYRLASLGFLAGKALQDEGSLYLGVRNQRLALYWVQENIRKFGGDPKGDEVKVDRRGTGKGSEGRQDYEACSGIYDARVGERKRGSAGWDSLQLFVTSNTDVERQCRIWQVRHEYLEVIASPCIDELTSSRSNATSDQAEVPDVHDPAVVEEYGIAGGEGDVMRYPKKEVAEGRKCRIKRVKKILRGGRAGEHRGWRAK